MSDTRRRSSDRALHLGAARPRRTTACPFLCAVVATLTTLACSHDGASGAPTPALPGPDGARSPRYDRISAIATHNSYWVDRRAKDDTFASGTNLRFDDQLIAGRARSIEIDVHRDPDVAGRFRVYHTAPGNDLCDDLRDCLAQVRLFHRALPQHEVLDVTIELKELFASNFDDAHTIEDLDRVLRDELPGLLYTPQDFLARCDRGTDAAKVDHETLAACAARKDWPGIDELRGKVMVSVIGNWDDLGQAQATSDWVRYATKDDVRARVGFPMASSWKLSWVDLGERAQELVTQAMLDAAFAQSVFLQIESLDDAKIDPFLARHGVIRVDGASTKDDQIARIDRGMQLLQTDTPFVRFGDDRPSVAFLPLGDRTQPGILEPGSRLLLHASGEIGERVFAWAPLGDATTTTWEALVSAGAQAGGGCLRIATDDDGPDAPAFTVCRSRIDAPLVGGELAQNALITIETCGLPPACTRADTLSQEPALGGVGDLLQLVVRRDAGRTCVRARSTDTVDRSFAPQFVDVGDEVCFDQKLSRIGLARIRDADLHGGTDPAWMIDVRRDGAPVTAAMLTVSVEGGSAPAHVDPTKLEDATVP